MQLREARERQVALQEQVRRPVPRERVWQVARWEPVPARRLWVPAPVAWSWDRLPKRTD